MCTLRACVLVRLGVHKAVRSRCLPQGSALPALRTQDSPAQPGPALYPSLWQEWEQVVGAEWKLRGWGLRLLTRVIAHIGVDR